MKKTIIYLGYATAWQILKLLPEKIAYRLGDLAADQAYKRGGKGIERLRKNYSRALGSKVSESLVRAGVRSYLRYWIDTFRFPKWDKNRIISTVVCEGEELLRNPIMAGRGVIVSLPHAGNWDHAGAYFCATGIPLTTVAEHLEPEKLFRKFLSFRQNIGMEVLDLNSRSIAILSQRARAGKLIALVADRDLSQNGVPVELCGHTAKFPAGPALLAIQTGAALITAFIRYEDKGIRIIFGGEIPVPSDGDSQSKVSVMSQEVANRFGKELQKNPVDWHMMQRIWPDLG
jgi:phosphatidylinositol dimannoside acyltransferase